MQKSTVGGILSIVAGALGLISGLAMLLFSLLFSTIWNDPAFFTGPNPPPDQFFTVFSLMYGVIGVFYIALGVLSIVGGIFSIQRKHWGWALAGAIGGCLTFLPLGVGAVVLVALGRTEFIPVASVQPPVSVSSTI
jgi:hypothetical protein